MHQGRGAFKTWGSLIFYCVYCGQEFCYFEQCWKKQRPLCQLWPPWASTGTSSMVVLRLVVLTLAQPHFEASNIQRCGRIFNVAISC